MTGIVRVYGTLIALLALIAVFAVAIPNFATPANFLNITLQISFLVMMATGTTLIMAVAEYDLSVGAMAGLGGVVAAQLAIAGYPPLAYFLAVLLMGGLLGSLTGLVVTGFRVLSF